MEIFKISIFIYAKSYDLCYNGTVKILAAKIIVSKDIKGEYKSCLRYVLGIYKEVVQIALRRIPKDIAKILNLYIFSVDDNGKVEINLRSLIRRMNDF